MAVITLIRHGKAEMPSIIGRDFDRKLTPRGRKNSRAMGQFIVEQKLLPELVIVSPSSRTRETYQLANQAWPGNLPVRFIDSLYEASAETLLMSILENGEKLASIMVIGHNPSLAVLLNYMTRHDFSEFNTMIFPTCCVAAVCFEPLAIRDIDPESGKLTTFKKARDL
jgi:phosphohistidine phosphatase